MFILTHTDRRQEHSELATQVLNTAAYPDVLLQDPRYLQQLRKTKIHLMQWARRLTYLSTPFLTLAALAYARLALF